MIEHNHGSLNLGRPLPNITTYDAKKYKVSYFFKVNFLKLFKIRLVVDIMGKKDFN
jgi:hypothetical protein